MADLTEDELNFIGSQRIDESAVMDCANLSPRRYKKAMEHEGYLFCIAPRPCYDSHRLRSRSGHCIQCDTARIGFTKRQYATAYIYIAGSHSSQVIKVGNAIWPERRVSALNSRRYGDIRDWVLLYHIKYEQAGSVEFKAHGYLSPSRIGRHEIFRCNYTAAREALARAAAGWDGQLEWESRHALAQYSFYAE